MLSNEAYNKIQMRKTNKARQDHQLQYQNMMWSMQSSQRECYDLAYAKTSYLKRKHF